LAWGVPRAAAGVARERERERWREGGADADSVAR